MNIREIEKSLEKYFNGESSLAEEETLMEFFSGEDVPEHLRSIAPQFRYYQAQQQIKIQDAEFDEKVLERIDKDRILIFPAGKRSKVLWIAGAAASILILVAVFMKLSVYSDKIMDTYSDPAIAYQEARKIVLFVSGKYAKGTEPLSQIAKFDEGMKDMKPLSRFDQGLQEASKINKYNKIEEIFGETY